VAPPGATSLRVYTTSTTTPAQRLTMLFCELNEIDIAPRRIEPKQPTTDGEPPTTAQKLLATA
jgi:hypothetical protein